jgi:hypothetical protein
MWANIQYSGVAVVQLHEEAGNHQAQLPDIYAPVAWHSHTCFYTVWCAHYSFICLEVVDILR